MAGIWIARKPKPFGSNFFFITAKQEIKNGTA